ncbi:acyltransferase family protein [Neobacillus rhizophilus]|uniref:Acyltransferase n=1 Tax=Neobacillus rhizophilus TaxID=2833579 RepID=A0A942YVM2_9BACI|nr:acyltransferase [Neobacillus rhizophilus]MBS4213120.1 acyltransferase [Neobacillus rhizophilus]
MFLKGKSIDQYITTRKNNLDFIRFIAAALVLFSHSYPLTLGNNGSEPFAILTKGQMTFGEFAVSIFFVISGFLITQSFERSKSPISYFKARFLRIFPGLIFVVFLSIFLLGPIFTDLSLKDYFTARDTYEYLSTISLYWIQYDLPGVFQTNVWPTAINGSLWTLWYEFFFYIVVAVLGVTRLLNKRIVLFVFILNAGLHFFNKDDLYYDLFRYFSSGMLFYLFRKQIKLNGTIAILSFIILLLAPSFGYFESAFSIFGAYLIFYLGYEAKLGMHNFSKYGDFSYGIYIYAFPIQQIMVHLFNNKLSPLEDFFLSLPFTLIFAFISWHLIEKNALKLKNFSLNTEKKSLIKIRYHSNNKNI